MYRWHKELPLLQSRLRQRRNVWKIKEDRYCELGMFRKVTPLRCPHSRKRGTGGCKMHKNMGNGKGAFRIRHWARLKATKEEIKRMED